MITILNILRHLVFNRFVWVIGLLLLATWCIFSSFTGAEPVAKPEDNTDIIALIEKENPDKAGQIRDMKLHYKPEVLSVCYQYYRKMYPEGQVSRFCDDLIGGNVSTQACLQTIEMVRQCGGEISEDQLLFLDAMAAKAIGPAANDKEKQANTVALEALKNYTDILAHAHATGGDTARLVRSNAIAAMMYYYLCMNKATASAKDWALYSSEHEWMTDMLTLLLVTEPNEIVVSQHRENVELSQTDYLKGAVELCDKYPTMAQFAEDTVHEWRKAIEENQVADKDGHTEADTQALRLTLIYEIYYAYGKVADIIAAHTYRTPEEILTFLKLNETTLQEFRNEHQEHVFIQIACDILKEKGTIEEHAFMQPHFLRLYYEVGANALHTILAKDPAPGFLYLLSAACSDEQGKLNATAARNAAAYAKIDPGHASQVLNSFGHDPRFKNIIAKDSRMMMYLDRFGENFEALNDDDWQGYVNKEITPDGKWKTDWTDYVPLVGATIKVTKNWACGYPCTWGELGWAAWEVGEGIAIITATVTTGAGGAGVKVASTAAKTALKGGGKALSKNIVKKTASQHVTKYLRSSFKTLLTKKSASIVLKNGLRMGKVILKKKIPAAWKGTLRAAKSLSGARKTMYAIAVTMVMTEICVRVLPNIDVENLPSVVGETIGNTVKEAMQVPLKVLAGMVKGMVNNTDSGFSSGLYFGIGFLLVALLIAFFPSLVKQYHKRLS